MSFARILAAVSLFRERSYPEPPKGIYAYAEWALSAPRERIDMVRLREVAELLYNPRGPSIADELVEAFPDELAGLGQPTGSQGWVGSWL